MATSRLRTTPWRTINHQMAYTRAHQGKPTALMFYTVNHCLLKDTRALFRVYAMG